MATLSKQGYEVSRMRFESYVETELVRRTVFERSLRSNNKILQKITVFWKQNAMGMGRTGYHCYGWKIYGKLKDPYTCYEWEQSLMKKGWKKV